ncbi:MAG: phage holin family protein [Fimbriimonadaceae bacterium]|nr:phage holin family protein [Fimbriimonadaceae bacterium]
MRQLTDGIATIGKMFGDAPLLKYLAGVSGACWGYLFPDQAVRDAALAAGLLILLDTVTGLWAAIVTGKAVKSAKFGRALSKILGYGSVVAVCAVVTRHVPGASAWQSMSVSAVVTLVIVTEAISILENVRKLGIKLPFGMEKLLEERLRGAPAREDA